MHYVLLVIMTIVPYALIIAGLCGLVWIIKKLKNK